MYSEMGMTVEYSTMHVKNCSSPTITPFDGLKTVSL
jgi:hypothetical protein